MDERAFIIAGNTAAIIANDGADIRYSAASSRLPVGVQTAASSNATAETQIVIAAGVVEIMIGGGTAIAFDGDFVRIPPGVIFACRNAGEEPATLLTRIVRPIPARRGLRIDFGFAA